MLEFRIQVIYTIFCGLIHTKQNSVCSTLSKAYMAVASVGKRTVKCLTIAFFQIKPCAIW